MAYYADLEHCDYFGTSCQKYLVAVGWLERGQPYRRRGDLTVEFRDNLRQLLADPWTPLEAFAGIHDCELCRFSTGVPGIQYLLVPGDGVFYVSPDNIHHYIDAHGYCPPEEYCTAVLECPPRRSTEFLQAVKKAGGVEMMRAFKKSV